MINSSYTIWICQCYMLTLANGECCADEHEYEPLRIYSAREITLGMRREEHAEDCDPDDDCDCDFTSYSTSPCQGCGDWCYGERHAATYWESE